MKLVAKWSASKWSAPKWSVSGVVGVGTVVVKVVVAEMVGAEGGDGQRCTELAMSRIVNGLPITGHRRVVSPHYQMRVGLGPKSLLSTWIASREERVASGWVVGQHVWLAVCGYTVSRC